ncbi:hypothetical protein FA13DRAFT_1793943 [Coprinellus micaceus]|uniref:F-box domain-containing protein n=1 Tax=Coprinellus micaceus TaxID=71717 RepID=A0A4Y7T3H0_COPMI|nr:hypothetical protein FA13DRAFT_1793943 [Coprinellus micaceus]
MPKLWPVLQVDIGCRLTCDRLKSWFLHSQGLPKAVTFTESWTPDSNLSLPHREIGKFLIEGPILDQLSLRCYSMVCLQSIVNYVELLHTSTNPGAWDSLRSLTLNIRHWGDEPLRNDCLQQLPPSLSHLSLVLPWWDHFLPANEHPIECISHPNITSLDLECNWPSSWILDTLTSCTRLDALSLRIKECPRTATSPWLDTDPTYTLPNLRTLRLRQPYHYVRYEDILRSLVLPSLGYLDISLKSDAGDEEYGPELALRDYAKEVTQLAQNSDGFVNLCRFRLHWPYPIGSAGLTSFFRHLPSISHLILDQADFHPSIFHRDFEFLPQLQVLELRGMPSTFDYNGLAPFVEERNSQQGSLRVLRGDASS